MPGELPHRDDEDGHRAGERADERQRGHGHERSIASEHEPAACSAKIAT